MVEQRTWGGRFEGDMDALTRDFEATVIRTALKHTHGRRIDAATRLGVGRNTICDTIVAGARSAADIGAKLKAGTNCGSCIPELKRLIAQTCAGSPESRKLAAAN